MSRPKRAAISSAWSSAFRSSSRANEERSHERGAEGGDARDPWCARPQMTLAGPATVSAFKSACERVQAVESER